jgi:disulfide bond formation protein DsbB
MYIKVFNKFGLIFFQASSIFILEGAFLLEIFAGANPCELCLWQRICWLGFLLLTLLFKKTYLLILPLLINAGLALYQILMAYGIIPDLCSVIYDGEGNIVGMTSCVDSDYIIFGLRLSEYNFLMSLGMIVLLFFYIRLKNAHKTN